ncbi:DUF922 domain-containing protein [Winogradskyella sp.]|uniref:DUF922 domain-containing protein n=1 Tax=Winogradskyella sp. TaxID=1883156 RepID=UPI003F6C1994
MKKNFVFWFLIVLISCSPKLKSQLEKKLNPLADDKLVIVLEVFDDQDILGDFVGIIEAKDGGLSVNCTYYENVLNLKRAARNAGANVVKITYVKQPDKWSTCHRLKAKIYKVKNPKLYETRIEWNANRKLTWDDFKGEPDTINHPTTLAMTNSGIGYESGINMFKEGKVFVQSFFYTNKSWVTPEGRSDYVLRHEQIHFDITEIYSRKLRKELAGANITSKNSQNAEPIFNRIINELTKRQDRYDEETMRGDRKETQEHWEAVVKLELAKYNLYKSN